MEEYKKYKLEKALAIKDIIEQEAEDVVKYLRVICKPKNKYFFKRDYSRGRSRRDKEKISIAKMNMQVRMVTASIQLRRIISTPIPKFEKGANV